MQRQSFLSRSIAHLPLYNSLRSQIPRFIKQTGKKERKIFAGALAAHPVDNIMAQPSLFWKTLVQSVVTVAIFICASFKWRTWKQHCRNSGFWSFLTFFSRRDTFFFFLSCYYTQHSKNVQGEICKMERELFSGQTKLEQGSLQTLSRWAKMQPVPWKALLLFPPTATHLHLLKCLQVWGAQHMAAYVSWFCVMHHG